jgi:uncharacterized membrane protein YqaE (UPF0057 family)
LRCSGPPLIERTGSGEKLFRHAGNPRPPESAQEEAIVFKVLLVLLCLVLPWLAVLIKEGPSLRVLWAFLLQLCGHVPGVVYGIYRVVND